jgi:hypothetical protein
MIEQPTPGEIKESLAQSEILDSPNLAVLRVRSWLRAMVRHAEQIQSDKDKAIDHPSGESPPDVSIRYANRGWRRMRNNNDVEKRRRALALEVAFQKARLGSDRLGEAMILKLEDELEEARRLAMQTGQFDAAAHATLTKALFFRVHVERPADLPPLSRPRFSAVARRGCTIRPGR